ncbi:MAG TPA: T9SS type A sorting domain-containing protein, partial [Chryseosolibacter sp.]
QSGDEFFEAAEPIQKSLTVVKAPQTIVFSELSPKQVSDAAFSLLATIDSPLAVHFSSDNEEVATVNGNVLTLRAPGTANITASQPGDRNYLAASPVTRKLVVDQVTALETASNPVRVYPNPANDHFQIAGEGIAVLKIVNALGNVQTDYHVNGNTVDVKLLAPGVYFVIVLQGEAKTTMRVVKY